MMVPIASIEAGRGDMGDDAIHPPKVGGCRSVPTSAFVLTAG
ncbi:MAG: hypothetical protein ACOYLM_09625 [Methylococcaceae bacterium]